jgi:hypothetical protein
MPSQAGNVGNLGDILKHAPIPDLVDILLEAARRVACFDPFAFALGASLPPGVDVDRWLADLEALRMRRPAYGRLLEIQGPRLARGLKYRCGIGLALDAIGPDRLLWLLAAESVPVLRRRLENGLRAMGRAGALVANAVLADAAEAPAAIDRARASVKAGDGLFALIDPFNIRSCPWEPVLEGLSKALLLGAHAIALVFTFGAHDWPSELSPAGRLRRVRRIREGPYQLAACATEAMAGAVARAGRVRVDLTRPDRTRRR